MKFTQQKANQLKQFIDDLVGKDLEEIDAQAGMIVTDSNGWVFYERDGSYFVLLKVKAPDS